MAHRIWTKKIEKLCPRCGCDEARLAIYHFGATTTAECAHCSFGKVSGDSEEMAMARLLGSYYEMDI